MVKFIKQLFCKHVWEPLPYNPEPPSNGSPMPPPLFTSVESECAKCGKIIQDYQYPSKHLVKRYWN